MSRENGRKKSIINTPIFWWKRIFSHYTLQTHITLIFFLILFTTTFSVIIYSYQKNIDAVTAIAENFLERTRKALISEVNNSFLEAQTLTTLGARTYNEEKEVSFKNLIILGTMRDLLINYPYITHVFTSTKSGKYLEMRRVFPEDTYYSDSTRKLPFRSQFAIRFIEEKKSQEFSEMWLYEDFTQRIIDKEIIEKSSFSFRNQLWYKKVLETQGPVWSDIRIFKIMKKPGFTISYPVYNDLKEEFIGAFAFDIEISGLSRLLNRSKVGKNGLSIIINKKGEVIGHSDISETMQVREDEIKIALVKDLKDKKLNLAYEIYEKTNLETFSFSHEGKNYIASFSKFPPAPIKSALKERVKSLNFTKDWIIGVIIPSNEFLGEVKTIQQRTLLLSSGFLFISILIMIFLVRHIAKPIITLASEADKIKNFDLTSNREINSWIFEIQLLNNSIISMRQSMKAFSKFVPKILVAKLLKTHKEINIGGQLKRTTFLFTDITNFTTVSEGCPSDTLALHLSEYFEELTQLIMKYNGVIDKYIGDGIMALWGVPNTDKDQALNACKAALAIQKNLASLNHKWSSEKKPILQTRIGLHIGEAIVGNMGSSDRMSYTALGDSVNLASRLEGVNKNYHTHIIISEDLFKEVKDKCLGRPLDIVSVKGKTEGTKIYELIGIFHDEAFFVPSKLQIEFCDKFARAFQFYLEKRWLEALTAFQTIKEEFGPEYVTTLYIKRCKKFKKHPPSPDWNGVISITQK